MSKANEHKPGYQHTPLGWIPVEWDVRKLSKMVGRNICYGVVQPGEEDIEGVKFIRGGDIIDGTISKNVRVISKKVADQYKRTYLNGGELLVSLVGYPGETAIVPKAYVGANIARQVGLVDIKNPDVAVWAHYYISSPVGKRELLFESFGSAQQVINLEQLNKFLIPIPPDSELQKVCSILSTWDEAIAKTQQLIEQLRQRNKGLMQHLLKVKGNWKEYHIGDLLKEVKRPVKWNDEELYHLISVRRRSGGAFFRESLYGKQILTKQLFTAEEGDFLISKMQIVHGASAVVPRDLAGMKISGSYIAVRTKAENIMDINFFNCLSKTRWFYRLTYVSSYGVHIEKMTFNFDDFKRRKIMLPPSVEEQYRIVINLQTANDEVRLYEQTLASLKQQKKGLMQKLLTGEVRVKIDKTQN